MCPQGPEACSNVQYAYVANKKIHWINLRYIVITFKIFMIWFSIYRLHKCTLLFVAEYPTKDQGVSTEPWLHNLLANEIGERTICQYRYCQISSNLNTLCVFCFLDRSLLLKTVVNFCCLLEESILCQLSQIINSHHD